MRKTFSILLLIVTTKLVIAQAPQKFAYQGVARNASGNPIVNQLISIRASIIDGSPTGTIQYSETHNVNTNAMGLFTVEIGGGSLLSGSFPAITWGGGTKYMKVEFDPTGGSSYTLVGTTQILSVPYALYAASSGSSTSNLPSGTNGQTLRHDGSNWVANSNLINTGSQVGVGTTPNASAVLDVASTTGGFLAPRLTTIQRNAIVSPASGLMIYNIACGNFQYYNGTSWIDLNSPTTNNGTIGSISGPTSVCTNASNITYSVTPVSGIVSYTWTVPTGAAIVSGQGTNVIVVNFGSTSGSIDVSGSNSCNPSLPSTASKAVSLSVQLPIDPIPNAATSITDSTANLSWSSVSGATCYGLQVSTNSGFTSFFSTYNGNNCLGTSSTIYGLSCNTTYYFRLRARNSCDTTNYSNVLSFTTPVASPAVADSANLITSSSFVAHWHPGTGASFRLDVSTSPTFASFVSGYNNFSVPAFSSGSYQVTGLISGTTYYYRVRRVTSCGTSVNSNTMSVTTN